MTSSLEYSAVNFIGGWKKLTWSIKLLSDSTLDSTFMFPNEKYVIYVPRSNHCFFFKNFQQFFLEISHTKNIIRSRKLGSNNGSTFLFESFFIKFKYIIKTISTKSAKVLPEICLFFLVSKNLYREARPSPCGMLV